MNNTSIITLSAAIGLAAIAVLIHFIHKAWDEREFRRRREFWNRVHNDGDTDSRSGWPPMPYRIPKAPYPPPKPTDHIRQL
jgi:hypothetical protein